MNKYFFSIIVLIFCVSKLTFSQIDYDEVDKLKKELTSYINSQMKLNNVTGVSIAVVDNQEILWAEGFGYADKENNIKATEKTVYRVGSVSKLFTATSIMQLAEDDKINIENSVKSYIPEFNIKSRYDDTILVKNLLTHHSGLPSDIFKDFFTDDSISYETIIDDLNNEYTCQPVGYVNSYSNAAYTLLGCIVERVSGQKFVEYTQKQLFEPLEMYNSGFELSENMKKLYAKGYIKDEPFDEPLLRDLSAGMLQTNVLDMSNFIKMTFNNGKFNGKQILDSATLIQMQTPQNENCTRDFTSTIGLCWWLTPETDIWDYAGGIASHGGDTYVYHTELLTLPVEKLGVVVMTNSSNGIGVVRKIAYKALEDFLKIQRGLTMPEEERKSVKLNKKSSLDYSGWEGDYSVAGSYVPIYKKGKYLKTNIEGTKFALIPNLNGSFTPQIKVLGILKFAMKSQQINFIEIDDQRHIIIVKNRDTSVIGLEFDKEEISDEWLLRCGEYKIINDSNSLKLIETVTLFVENGVLQIKGKAFNESDMTFALNPINSDEAIIPGIGRSTGYTVSFWDNKFRFSGLEFEKVE